jgi:hypothetical protein
MHRVGGAAGRGRRPRGGDPGRRPDACRACGPTSRWPTRTLRLHPATDRPVRPVAPGIEHPCDPSRQHRRCESCFPRHGPTCAGSVSAPTVCIPARRRTSRAPSGDASRQQCHPQVQRLGAGERPSYGRIRPMPGGRGRRDRPGRIRRRVHPLRTGDGVLIGGGGSRWREGDDGPDRRRRRGRRSGVGDDVVLLGRQGDEEITADEWALELGTVAYEIVCSIGPRVPRRYTR